MEQCANCQRSIGDLEPVHLHDGRVVCVACKARLSGPAPQLIEQTAKRWKLIEAAGVFLILAGVAVCVGGYVLHQSAKMVPYLIAGAGGIVLGLPVYFVARVGSWWHHG